MTLLKGKNEQSGRKRRSKKELSLIIEFKPKQVFVLLDATGHATIAVFSNEVQNT